MEYWFMKCRTNIVISFEFSIGELSLLLLLNVAKLCGREEKGNLCLLFWEEEGRKYNGWRKVLILDQL